MQSIIKRFEVAPQRTFVKIFIIPVLAILTSFYVFIHEDQLSMSIPVLPLPCMIYIGLSLWLSNSGNHTFESRALIAFINALIVAYDFHTIWLSARLFWNCYIYPPVATQVGRNLMVQSCAAPPAVGAVFRIFYGIYLLPVTIFTSGEIIDLFTRPSTFKDPSKPLVYNLILPCISLLHIFLGVIIALGCRKDVQTIVIAMVNTEFLLMKLVCALGLGMVIYWVECSPDKNRSMMNTSKKEEK